jgi:hypothetical protein
VSGEVVIDDTDVGVDSTDVGVEIGFNPQDDPDEERFEPELSDEDDNDEELCESVRSSMILGLLME